jgi:hypothetical protein
MKQSNTNKVVQAVKSVKTETGSLIVLSTGVTLHAERVPNLIFLEVTRRFKAPKVPRYMNADLGREEDNPGDPDYIEAYNQYQADLSVAVIDTMVVVGTSLASVPEGVYGPSDEGWTKRLRIIGIDPGEDEMERYLKWVKYYAASKDEDINRIAETVGRLSGVAEEDVAEAIDQFRNIS